MLGWVVARLSAARYQSAMQAKTLSLALIFLGAACSSAPELPAEADGLLIVEAETFARQTIDETRRWYVVNAETTGTPEPDPDPSHAASASGGAYLEILPDTRTNHDERLIRGENFTNKAGMMAILEYDIAITNPGRYYVWVSAHSTGTEDNGIHVGLDGQWPDSGQRMQWCEGKDQWTWGSRQRTEADHCGVPGLIYLEIEEPGPHTVQFSMREDGFEFDRWLLTNDRDYIPNPPPPARPVDE